MKEEKQYVMGNQWGGMNSYLSTLKHYGIDIDAVVNQRIHDVSVAKGEMAKEEPKNDYKYILIRR